MNSVRSLRSLGAIYRNALPIASYRYSSSARNTFINFVPQQEAWVVERMGKFYKILDPGLNILIPFLDRIKFVQNLREIAIEIPQQGAITLDNVQLQLDGVLYLRVFNPYRASYGVDDPEFAVTQLAQTTMRSEVGKISLDTVFKEREQLNESIVDAINKAAEPWGIKCMRYEIRDMHMPEKIQEAMQMQVEAERKKRAAILESEGHRESAINKAEGEKRAAILASEAREAEQINVARGQAEALRINAEAKAQAIERIAAALNQKGGDGAASLTVAQQYVEAFQHLAKESNTVILPASLSEPSSMVAQALTLYNSIGKKPTKE
ncbi:hypothetical protein V3C99_004168 [Haemonchus contortus]|uniref:PHB domain-containing protein n=1 Tax=Haemonchus contortus TaxID=6289 RepID=A0A7I4XZ72_HAECO|nr:Band 7 protein domain containing protein [Haemonchus contortus]